jgi:hypothetical protein
LSARLIVGGSHLSIEEVRGQIAEVKPQPKGSYFCNLTSNL